MTGAADAGEDATRICSELIRVDTSNHGDGRGPGERKAAEYVAGLLAEAGVEPLVVEAEPGRANVLARIPGRDREADALLVHGHRTDAKAFAGIGIRSYGFAPLLLPPGLDYWGLFHGVDERVPVDGLAFGVRVLDRFLGTAPPAVTVSP